MMTKHVRVSFLAVSLSVFVTTAALAQEPEAQELPETSHQLQLPQSNSGEDQGASAMDQAQPQAADSRQGVSPGQVSPKTNSNIPAGSNFIGTPSAEGGDKMFSGFIDPFDYAPSGRRDPFVQPIPDKPMEQGNVAGPLLPLQKFELGQLRLVGIIWDVKRPKAMIKDPGGITHVVGPNTKVGPRNGYIAVIREGEMVVVETNEQDGRLVSSAQVVKIAK